MRILLALVLSSIWSACALAQPSGLVSIPSRYAVAETIDRFEAAARTEQFQVFARVDFKALAAANGADVRPSQLLIFGRGGILPPLLPLQPLVAIDLPLKALAWQDADGKVWLAYNTGEYLRERHGVAGQDTLLKRLTEVTAALAKKAAD